MATSIERQLLEALVKAMDSAFISVWQSTAAWQKQLDDARQFLEHEELPDTPAVVVGAPENIWLNFGNLSEFRGQQVQYSDLYRSGDISWCQHSVDETDVKYIRADLVKDRAESNNGD